MTVGQLCEALISKVSGHEGHETDGTPFNDPDLEDMKDRLEKLGYDRTGCEYMYNGMTGKQMRIKIFICPTYYQRLKHLVSDKIHCLTLDHEVLTYDGWKQFTQLNYSDKIATLKNNELVYDNPTELIYYHNYHGKLYKIETEQINLQVTGNHRMYVSQDDNDFELIKAEEINGLDVHYKKNTKWNKNDYNDIGFLTSFNSYVRINKKLPKWTWELSEKQTRIIINDLVSDQDYYYTTSSKMADDFMRLCLHAGWSANKIQEYNLWKLNINKDNRVSVNRNNVIKEYLTDYNGAVFCLQVPSEVFYVRRCGVGSWTGNSRARGPRTALTRQAPEGRARDGGLRFGEMERDSIISHGMARFLKERLMDTADAYTTHVCSSCGLFAQRMQRKDKKSYATTNDIYICPGCKNYKDNPKIRIPYAFKLLVQEMMAMSIAPRIRVKSNEFSE